ncbi:hypothetical protein CIB95_09830 [Lottiidibacillus patelloidae]|uniref:Uncharacterized protein n=1 Tax=Lottiidibacillus patelloidae TaxID=2670334 RepID=A0A263BTQ2_9BACI|nr:hypothetical protein CIB95_09830 [Lottiidibacillus patelloidae]
MHLFRLLSVGRKEGRDILNDIFIAKLKRKDESAFRLLIEEYGNAIYNFVILKEDNSKSNYWIRFASSANIRCGLR